ncbi:MAG: phosphatidate cytidylyltransferase, partial [Rhodospirillales bacterium]|nr:phosphatidate cytidylyltransferase [Rhodospirillales bacterium]
CLALIAIRQVPGSGRDVIIWLFLVVWATDIGAYVFGRSIGGFKLAPSISPNKTWAGLIGGIASAIAVASIISATGNAKTGILTLIILSAAAALISQCGDLLESWIKRRFNAKDSGNLIPGHGGLLDRVDGLFLAASAALLLIVVYQGGDMPWK